MIRFIVLTLMVALLVEISTAQAHILNGKVTLPDSKTPLKSGAYSILVKFMTQDNTLLATETDDNIQVGSDGKFTLTLGVTKAISADTFAKASRVDYNLVGTDFSGTTTIGDLTAPAQANSADAAADAAQKHELSLLGLYSAKGKTWQTGAGFVGDFGRLMKVTPGPAYSRKIHGVQFDGPSVTYQMLLSGVIGFTDGASNQINTGFGIGLRNVFFDGKLSFLVGQYVQFVGGKAQSNWLFGLTFSF